MAWRSPFEEVRVEEGDEVQVRVFDKWVTLVSVNNNDIETLVSLARSRRGGNWVESFNDDLPSLAEETSHPFQEKIACEVNDPDAGKLVILTFTCTPAVVENEEEKLEALTAHYKSALQMGALLGLSKEELGFVFATAQAPEVGMEEAMGDAQNMMGNMMSNMMGGGGEGAGGGGGGQDCKQQ